MTSAKYDAELERFQRATGQTIRKWAELEYVLWLYLQAFVPVDQFRIRTIWASLPSYQARRMLLKRFADTYLPETERRKFEKLLQRVSKFSSKRNALAHGLGGYWHTGHAQFTFDDYDSETGMSFLKKTRFQLTNIEAWPKAIDQLIIDLMDWLPACQAAISESPTKSSSSLP